MMKCRPILAASFKRICKPVKYKHVRMQRRGARLVADLLEVLAQLDDRVECVGRLDRVGVVGDEERLCGLVGDDALLALGMSVLVWGVGGGSLEAHLLGLERVLGRLNGHVLFAVDLDAVCDDGLGLALVVERGGNGAHLGGGQLQPVSAVRPVSSLARPAACDCACGRGRGGDVRRSLATRPRWFGR
jgi:hypothetical protein